MQDEGCIAESCSVRTVEWGGSKEQEGQVQETKNVGDGQEGKEEGEVVDSKTEPRGERMALGDKSCGRKGVDVPKHLGIDGGISA